MKRNNVWIAVAVLALALAAGSAWSFSAGEESAQAPPAGPPPGRMEGMPMAGGFGMHDELGLTEEQQERLRALWLESSKSGMRANTDLRIAHMELEELMQAATPDRAAIEAKLRQINEAQNSLLRQRIEHRLAMQQVLTPEQRLKARHLMRRHMRQRWSGRGMGMRGPRGRGLGPGRGFGPGGPPQD